MLSRLFVLLSAGVLMLGITPIVSAEYGKKEEAPAQSAPAADSAAAPATGEADQPVMASDMTEAVEVGNKICPIEGGPVEEGKEYKVTHNGKVYNLCCAMCEAEFMKDPEAAIKKLESMEAAKAEGLDAAAEAEGMAMEAPAETK